MPHRRFEFEMPASQAVVFDAFHHQHWRFRWDSLVKNTKLVGGGLHPFVGAVTDNVGAGALKALSMRTRFVAYDRPKLAAATMVGESFPFLSWAASMKHVWVSEKQSTLVYTYTFEVKPVALKWLLNPIVSFVFDSQTKRRFKRLASFLQAHASDVELWIEQTAREPAETTQ